MEGAGTSRPGADAMNRDSPRTVVARTCTVGDEHRDFSIPQADMRKQYGIDDDLATELLDLGLPHRRDDGGLLFDWRDLSNVAAGLNLDSEDRVLMRRWTRSLGAALQQQRGVYNIRFDWRCPSPGHAGDCEFTLDPLTAPIMPHNPAKPLADGSLVGAAEPLYHEYDFGPAFNNVVAAARRITFHRLPLALVDDLGYLAETGLADCRLANVHLRKLAADAGLRVRPAAGLFVGVPFPARHAWFEVSVGDRWVAADPFFLHTLTSWGIMSGEEWPLNHSPRNVLIRLSNLPEIGGPLVLHNGHRAPLRILARWKMASAGAELPG
uniref:Putative MitI transglutaminase n=1 Tax=Amycolatopsis sp. SANK 60206 TaxID=1642649 RepID=A0A0E3Z9N4_9PSEU|nr:putative MitI transglutaminase [Amycolatopsis sp. SANK 60206]